MGTNLKAAMFTATMMFAALSAAADVTSPMVANDPLMKQIMSHQLTQAAGGVTGAVRIGSGQAITLSLIDPLAPLKPVEGLVGKPVVEKPVVEKQAKAKAGRKTRRADEQLTKMSEDRRSADWAGRK
jgi:hypothetical protein